MHSSWKSPAPVPPAPSVSGWGWVCWSAPGVPRTLGVVDPALGPLRRRLLVACTTLPDRRRRFLRHPLTWLLGLPVLVGLLASLGPWLFAPLPLLVLWWVSCRVLLRRRARVTRDHDRAVALLGLAQHLEPPRWLSVRTRLARLHQPLWDALDPHPAPPPRPEREPTVLPERDPSASLWDEVTPAEPPPAPGFTPYPTAAESTEVPAPAAPERSLR